MKETRLINAVKNDDIEEIKVILSSYPGLLQMQDNNGSTALMYAAKLNKKNIIKILKDIENNIKDNNGQTALMYAAKHGNGDKYIVNSLLTETGIQDKQGQTALMLAVYYYNSEVIKILADSGKELGKNDKNGNTALMYALINKDTEAIRILINYKDELELTLKNATKEIYTEIMQVLQNIPISIKSIVEIIRKEVINDSDIELFKTIIKRNIDNKELFNTLRSRYKKDSTALMFAVKYGILDYIDLLSKTEAELQDQNGFTALMYCTTQNFEKNIVELLLDKEAGIQNKFGQTALMCAAQNGRKNIVELLLDKEAGLQDKKGNTALMYAIEHYQKNIVEVLKDKEARITDNFGLTPLTFATEKNDIDMVKLLLPYAYKSQIKTIEQNLIREINKNFNKNKNLVIYNENLPIGCFNFDGSQKHLNKTFKFEYLKNNIYFIIYYDNKIGSILLQTEPTLYLNILAENIKYILSNKDKDEIIKDLKITIKKPSKNQNFIHKIETAGNDIQKIINSQSVKLAYANNF